MDLWANFAYKSLRLVSRTYAQPAVESAPFHGGHFVPRMPAPTSVSTVAALRSSPNSANVAVLDTRLSANWGFATPLVQNCHVRLNCFAPVGWWGGGFSYAVTKGRIQHSENTCRPRRNAAIQYHATKKNPPVRRLTGIMYWLLG